METVKVIWAAFSLLFDKTGSPAINKHLVGLCGHSKRVFRVAASSLDPIFITDIVIDNEVCEEGKRCLDFHCSLNHTNSHDDKIKIPETPAFEELFTQYPQGGVIIGGKRNG